MKEKTIKRFGAFRIILMILLCVVILAGVTFAIALGDDLSFENIVSAIQGESAGEFYYDNITGGMASPINDGLAALSSSSLSVFNRFGELEISQALVYSSPALVTSGKYGAAYDIGGKTLIFFTDDKIITELSLDFPVISASVNEKGYLAVCSEQTGWGGVVTVYNSKGSAVYRWSSGTAYVLSAKVHGKSELFVLTAGSTGSDIVLLPLNSETETARYNCDSLIFDFGITDSGISALTASSLIFLDGTLEKAGEYSFSGRYLGSYSFNSKNTLLVTGEYQLSADRTVTLIRNGQDTPTLEHVVSSPKAVDSDGTYICVLYADHAVVYNDDMSVVADFKDLSGYDGIISGRKGRAVVTGTYMATVLNPKGQNADAGPKSS